jgi:uncharacterized protein YqjF (DUF2071 family)
VTPQTIQLAVLASLAARHGGADENTLKAELGPAGLRADAVDLEIAALAHAGLLERTTSGLTLTSEGARTLLEGYAEIERLMDPSPRRDTQEDCPSIPWLTRVQTEWIDAISLNYAVDSDALRTLLPHPLEPELWKGTAWVQVLVSSLRDMRPQGLGGLFGVCFYQTSYRAAVRLREPGGEWRRGGYFVRSETNHEVMRAVGNTLTEFKFHAFGAAEMIMLRDGDRLSIAIEPQRAGGNLVAMIDTRPLSDPPAGSVWTSLAELQMPLVECYDAFGVDSEHGWLYTLTIDREPWNARFVTPIDLHCEFAESPALSGARLDSVLHIPRCAYRWRPLRREPLPGG